MSVLGEAFGTKKKKQEIKSRDKDTIHAESLLKTQALLQKHKHIWTWLNSADQKEWTEHL